MIFKSRFTLLFSIICLSSFLSACGGGGGGDGGIEQGITVNFQATQRQSANATGEIPVVSAGVKTFFNTEKVKITLKRAYVVIWSVKLVSNCDNVDFAQQIPTWWDFIFSPAYAHAETTPTQLGVPNVINILNADGQKIRLGEIYPAPASYCGITVELLKADEDTQYLPQDVNMLNQVFHVEGEYLPLGANNAVPFKLTLARAPRPRNIRFSLPLMLSTTQRTATIIPYFQYNHWFDGVDFAALETDAQIERVLNNVTFSIKIE